MKQSLQLRLGQQLTMTPQLQQAIKLLQLSSLDLQQEIQQALDSNMMLEVADDDGSPAEPQEAMEPANSEPEFRELSNLDTASDIPQELPVDSSWDEVYDSLQSFAPSSAADPDGDDFLLQRAPAQTLQDFLKWQMELTHFSERDYAIATAIIDAVDDDGYLTTSLDDIHQGLAHQIPDLDRDEVAAVLHRVQNFDPPGSPPRTSPTACASSSISCRRPRPGARRP